MLKKDQIKLSIPLKRYTCLDTIFVTCYYFTIAVTVIMGIQLLILALGIRLQLLVDLRVLEAYLGLDSNILLCVSILIILASTLGILSVAQISYVGLVTSIGLLVLLLGFIDIYAISNYRTKDYLTPSRLYLVLLDAMMINPFDNIPFHLMQKRLSCCGISDYNDWLLTYKFIPGSCCDNSRICEINDPSLNKNGCLSAVQKVLSNTYQNTVNVITVLNVVGIAAVFTGYFCSHLIRQLKRGDRILNTAIPRIQMSYNATRSQQAGQIFNSRNNRSSVQFISDETSPTAPSSIYPNLYGQNGAP